MAFWLDDEGVYYIEKSATELVSENGKYIFKFTPPPAVFLLLEDGFNFLQEDGTSKLQLES